MMLRSDRVENVVKGLRPDKRLGTGLPSTPPDRTRIHPTRSATVGAPAGSPPTALGGGVKEADDEPTSACPTGSATLSASAWWAHQLACILASVWDLGVGVLWFACLSRLRGCDFNRLQLAVAMPLRVLTKSGVGLGGGQHEFVAMASKACKWVNCEWEKQHALSLHVLEVCIVVNLVFSIEFQPHCLLVHLS